MSKQKLQISIDLTISILLSLAVVLSFSISVAYAFHILALKSAITSSVVLNATYYCNSALNSASGG